MGWLQWKFALRRKTQINVIGYLTGMDCSKCLLNNKKLPGLVSCFRQPLACLFGCAVGGKRIKNAALARRRQGRAAHDSYASDTVAYFVRVNINVRGRNGAMPPQRASRWRATRPPPTTHTCG